MIRSFSHAYSGKGFLSNTHMRPICNGLSSYYANADTHTHTNSMRLSPSSSSLISPLYMYSLPSVSPIRYDSRSMHSSNVVRRFSTTNNDKIEEEEPSDVAGKVKGMWKKYGVVAIGTYLFVYIATLSSIFVSLDYDIFNAATFGFDPAMAVQKVCDIFESVTGSKALPKYIREHPHVGTFAIAWVMTKFTEPLRLAVTVGIVPKIARFFGKA